MKCYKVQATGCVRLAGTGGEARAFRQAMVDEREDVKKKDVDITQVELKTAKPELLAFLNALLEQQDDNAEFEMPEGLTEIDKDAKKKEREAKKAAKAKPEVKKPEPKAEAPAKKAAPPAKKAPAKKPAPPAKKAPAKKPAKKR